jgi:hypothetical protein
MDWSGGGFTRIDVTNELQLLPGRVPTAAFGSETATSLRSPR